MDKADLIEALKGLDICFMHTHAEAGGSNARPMSNNGDVEWEGTNWFFSNGDTAKVAEIEADDRVLLTFAGEESWIALYGHAVLHRDDKALFEKHWVPDLEAWFEDGVETPGLTLIEVKAHRAQGWGRVGDGTLEL